MLRNTTMAWGTPAKILHWLIVLLIIGQFVLAEIAEDLPLGLEKLATLARHKSFGITILGLAVLRLIWRLLNRTPQMPRDTRPFEARIARGTHGLLYALLFAMPLSGWMMSSAKNYPVSWFGLLQLPDLVGPNERLYETLHDTHELLASALIAVSVLHLLGALRHHFFKRDDVLRRMLPFAVAGLLLWPMPEAGAATARFVLDPAASTLEFEFRQAGANSRGRFERFSTTLQSGSAPSEPAALRVQVDMASLNTRDADRDGLLRGAELFDVATHPTARFEVPALRLAADGSIKLNGQLTLRGVSRPLVISVTLRRTRESGRDVIYLRGAATIQRLDFGVGQGEWRSTEWVDNAVRLSFSVRLLAD